MILKRRFAYFLIFLGCISVLSHALFYLQLTKNLLPCPLCVVQRLAYCLIGLTALLAFLHNPEKTGQRVYSSLIIVFSLIGAVIALRQIWLIHYPEAFECGISPEESFLNALPMARWWPDMFEANGDCAEVSWMFLSLTIPDWSLIFFILFTSIALYTMFARKQQY
jgi:protein dithiol:quinone oxidoreductase